jgi:hypothetical protein
MKQLWMKWCSPEQVWDLWEVKETFMKVFRYKSFFLAAYLGRKLKGFLPLWYDSSLGHYDWISGWWAEYSRPFCSSKSIVSKMLDTLEGNIFLGCMDKKYIKYFPKGIKRDFNQYAIDLKKLNHDWEEYLKTIKKKKRQNIRRDIRSIEKFKPTVRYDRVSDLNILARLNILQMKRKKAMYDDEWDSVFLKDKNHMKAFKRLFQNQNKNYQARIITVMIKNKVVAVDFNLLYKNKYYCLLGGVNIIKYSGLGNYMNYMDINDSIKLGCDRIDFLMEAHHWKDDWIKGEPRYKFVREAVK